MIELTKLGDKTYCVKNPVNIGIYLLDDRNVCLIDTGNSKQFGKVLDKILVENNWNLKCIINTHSHADHIGGNKYLQQKYNCSIYASKVESYFINEPLLEPAMLYGAAPLKELCNPFLLAEESICEDLNFFNEEGLSIINLEGHSFGSIGVVTSDGVCFAGDAYTSRNILSKYPIQYIYDIDKFFNSIEYLKNSNYNVYVPSHGDIESDPLETLIENERVALTILDEIFKIIEKSEITFSCLLKKIFELHHIGMNVVQYHLISVTLKAFLGKLVNDKKIELVFEDNEMKIRKI